MSKLFRTLKQNKITKNKVGEFTGVFGMPNLDKLALHLKCPEYQKDSKI